MRGLAVTLVVLTTAAFAGCVADPGASAGRTLLDHTGHEVEVTDLTRLIPTSSDLAEILFMLGHGDRVVAIPSWSDHEAAPFPYPLGDQARLGRPHVLNAEEVIAEAPTLVLEKDHPLQPTPLADQLRAARVPVFVFDNTERLDNVHKTMRAVADILEPVDPDIHAKVERILADFDAQVADITARVASSDAPRPRLIYQLPAGFVTGSGTSADLLIGLAGGTNLAADAGLEGYRQISGETLADGDPERVLASRTAAGSAQSFFGNPRYAETTAARLGPETLSIVDPALTALVGPRFVQGVRDAAAWLHPAAFDLFVPTHSYGEDPGPDGLHITIQANATQVRQPPVTYRFDPGDGSAVVDERSGVFTHTYETHTTHLARVLTIDAAGHVHEQRFTIPAEQSS